MNITNHQLMIILLPYTSISYNALSLEEKIPEELFEDYDPNAMPIKVNFWRTGLEALTEEVL